MARWTDSLSVLSLNPLGSEVSKITATPESGGTCTYGESQLTESVTAGAIHWWGHLDSNFDELLETDYGYACEWGLQYERDPKTIIEFSSRSLPRVSQQKSYKNTLIILSGGGKSNHWISITYASGLGKNTRGPVSPLRKGHFSSPVSSNSSGQQDFQQRCKTRENPMESADVWKQIRDWALALDYSSPPGHQPYNISYR